MRPEEEIAEAPEENEPVVHAALKERKRTADIACLRRAGEEAEAAVREKEEALEAAKQSKGTIKVKTARIAKAREAYMTAMVRPNAHTGDIAWPGMRAGLYQPQVVHDCQARRSYEPCC